MRSPSLAAALFLVAGCTVVRSDPELRLAVLSPAIGTQQEVWIRIETTGADRAYVVIDAEELDAPYPVGEDVPLVVPEGEHEVRARVYRGASAQDSAPASVTVDTLAPTARFSPAPSTAIVDPAPFELVVSFDEPLDPASVNDDNARIQPTTSSGYGATSTVALAPDHRSLTLTASRPLGELGPVTVTLNVTDRVGFRPLLREWPLIWAAPRVEGAIQGSFLGWVSGIVQVGWSGNRSPVAVLVDDQPLGTVASGGALSWDTGTVSDGAHTLSISAPGYWVVVAPVPVWVQNVGPRG